MYQKKYKCLIYVVSLHCVSTNCINPVSTLLFYKLKLNQGLIFYSAATHPRYFISSQVLVPGIYTSLCCTLLYLDVIENIWCQTTELKCIGLPNTLLCFDALVTSGIKVTTKNCNIPVSHLVRGLRLHVACISFSNNKASWITYIH